jgi:glycosyltransferase involved in cell wall biosynthesis
MEIFTGANPCVSVILATFNRAAYLTRSINSVLNQTYKDYELIVVDDGSDDDTFSIVNQFIQKHENVRYLKHSNRKLSITKNTGIQAAAGRYIAFIDSDDEYKPDYLEKRVSFMKAHENIDLIEGGAIVIGNEYVKDRHDLSKEIHLSECRIGPTFFGKKEVFVTLGGFDKNILYSEDAEFWDRAEKAFSVKIVEEPLYIYYRDTPGSICNSI